MAWSCTKGPGKSTMPEGESGGHAGASRPAGAGGGGNRSSGGVTGTGGLAGSGGASAAAGGSRGSPTLGGHASAFTLNGKVSADALTTPPFDTQPTGSTIVVALARGNADGFGPLPTDNQGNSPYTLLGSVNRYSRWPDSGTALYAFPSAVGGRGHTVTVTQTASSETTLFVVEVRSAGRVQDAKFKEVTVGGSLTSPTVTTAGPATLVAVCWGDAGGSPTTFTAGDGFEIIEQQPLSEISIEGAVAVKNVASAGSYKVTWTATQQNSTDSMGALLYLVALAP